MAKTKSKQLKNRAAKATTSPNETANSSEAADNTNMLVNDDAVSMLLKRVKATDIDADFDTRSAVTSKSLRGLNIKKSDKRKLRHTVWTKKVGAIEAQIKEAKAKKKREATAVVGDMSTLLDSLPSFELLLDRSTIQSRVNKSSEQNRKQRSVETESRRKLQKLSDISLFKSVLAHPTFQSNPLSAITEHLRNKLQRDDDS